MNKVLSAVLLGMASVAFVGGCAPTRTQESVGQYTDDATITARVKAALLQESDVKSNEITVETFRGVVQLSGFVDNRDMAQRAVARAEQVPGVRSVKNDLQIRRAS